MDVVLGPWGFVFAGCPACLGISLHNTGLVFTVFGGTEGCILCLYCCLCLKLSRGLEPLVLSPGSALPRVCDALVRGPLEYDDAPNRSMELSTRSSLSVHNVLARESACTCRAVSRSRTPTFPPAPGAIDATARWGVQPLSSLVDTELRCRYLSASGKVLLDRAVGRFSRQELTAVLFQPIAVYRTRRPSPPPRTPTTGSAESAKNDAKTCTISCEKAFNIHPTHFNSMNSAAPIAQW